LAYLASAAGLAGCSLGHRTVRFESSVPASVIDSGGAILCEKTPCTWRLSRETCGLYDSSSGYFRPRAVDASGASLRAPALKTCTVREGTLVRFLFPEAAAGCSVEVVEKGEVRSRGECSLEPPSGRRR